MFDYEEYWCNNQEYDPHEFDSMSDSIWNAYITSLENQEEELWQDYCDATMYLYAHSF